MPVERARGRLGREQDPARLPEANIHSPSLLAALPPGAPSSALGDTISPLWATFVLLSGLRSCLMASPLGAAWWCSRVCLQACRKKQAALLVPCPGCRREYRKGDLALHMAACRALKKMSAQAGARAADAVGGGRAGDAAAKTAGQAGGGAAFAEALAKGGAMLPCAECGRRFRADRLGTHQAICAKVKHKPARPGEQAAQAAAVRSDKVLARAVAARADPRRLAAVAADRRRAEASTPRSTPRRQAMVAGEPRWKQQSETLRATLRAARIADRCDNEASSCTPADGGPPTYDPSLVECPHCLRTFNERAAERHIPHCKTARAKPTPPPRLRGSTPRGSSVGRGSVRLAMASPRAATAGLPGDESQAVRALRESYSRELRAKDLEIATLRRQLVAQGTVTTAPTVGGGVPRRERRRRSPPKLRECIVPGTRAAEAAAAHLAVPEPSSSTSSFVGSGVQWGP